MCLSTEPTQAFAFVNGYDRKLVARRDNTFLLTSAWGLTFGVEGLQPHLNGPATNVNSDSSTAHYKASGLAERVFQLVTQFVQ